MRLTDPLGELERFSHPLAEIGGCLLLRGRKGKGKREEEMGRGNEEGRGGREGEGGLASHTIFRPW